MTEPLQSFCIILGTESQKYCIHGCRNIHAKELSNGHRNSPVSKEKRLFYYDGVIYKLPILTSAGVYFKPNSLTRKYRLFFRDFIPHDRPAFSQNIFIYIISVLHFTDRYFVRFQLKCIFDPTKFSSPVNLSVKTVNISHMQISSDICTTILHLLKQDKDQRNVTARSETQQNISPSAYVQS